MLCPVIYFSKDGVISSKFFSDNSELSELKNYFFIEIIYFKV